MILHGLYRFETPGCTSPQEQRIACNDFTINCLAFKSFKYYQQLTKLATSSSNYTGYSVTEVFCQATWNRERV